MEGMGGPLCKVDSNPAVDLPNRGKTDPVFEKNDG